MTRARSPCVGVPYSAALTMRGLHGQGPHLRLGSKFGMMTKAPSSIAGLLMISASYAIASSFGSGSPSSPMLPPPAICPTFGMSDRLDSYVDVVAVLDA